MTMVMSVGASDPKSPAVRSLTVTGCGSMLPESRSASGTSIAVYAVMIAVQTTVASSP